MKVVTKCTVTPTNTRNVFKKKKARIYGIMGLVFAEIAEIIKQLV